MAPLQVGTIVFDDDASERLAEMRGDILQALRSVYGMQGQKVRCLQ